MRRRSLAQAGGAAAAVALGLALTAPAAPAAVQQAVPGGTTTAKAAGQGLANRLVRRVTATDANRHLIALQRIAERNGGTRAATTPGYEASVEYVVGRLRAAGFRVRTPEFTYQVEVSDANDLVVDGTTYDIEKMAESIQTPVGGITGPLRVVPVNDTVGTGCTAEQFAGLQMAGAVALIKRGGCTFALKASNAAAAGAAVAVVYNNVPGPLTNVTITTPGPIPVGGISAEDGAVLAGKDGATATVDMRVHEEDRTQRNVIAQTRTGRVRNVVMAGAHLDSVPAGPGINDNGSGSSALLDLALKLGARPNVNNAVRFGWWGAEELGLVGSTEYVRGLTFEQQLNIALYLNFDMVASPNAAYFVYDGDNSDAEGAGPGPYGSAQIERTFVDFIEDRLGVPTEGTDFTGRSDYGEFIAVGIPAGGLFTGAEGVKTADQAAKWGGTAGVAYDPCYHQACDNLGNLDRVALDRNLDAMAWAAGLYAKSTEDVNGVPGRAARAALRAAAANAVARTADAPARASGATR
jgi:Zn-dependent M28 family amino/carboxypeptidase